MSENNASAVPIVDISPFMAGTDAQRRAVAATVDRTNREIGFLVIIGHGFDMGLLARWFAVSRTFFEGSPSAKQAVTAPQGEQQGYHRLAQSGLAAKEGELAPPDLREYFMVGRLDAGAAEHSGGQAAAFHRPNRWPAGDTAFRQAGEQYYAAMERLGALLMRIFAMGLGLREDWFADKIDRHFSILSSIYYPVQPTPPLPGQLRAGAHTDYGSLTILAPNDAPGGLQVRALDGQWADVPYVADGFVINIGDMMQRWTNERWLSNMHRVVNPPSGSSRPDKPRQSIAYFLHPNPDAVIAAIPTCVSEDAPPRHPPILAGAYMREKESAIAAAKPAAGKA